ncbi:D-aspartate oxidase [Culicoides brevitarsis]|uniref:D-aspartate oxidase n=1 Tax=Culicoides brevitarsis TaxID=469753 RepID=UPI00307B5704
MKQILVIGAGVNGLSSAVKIAENFYNQAQVTLISEETSPNTTGDGSAGLWGPFLLGDTPEEKIVQWSKETHDFFKELWIHGLAKESGVTLIPCYRLTTEPGTKEPSWKHVVFGYNSLTEQELNRLRMEHGRNYTAGAQFITFTAEPTSLLPYLYKRFEKAGGRFIRRKVFQIDELANENYDLIVNCTGLGAKSLLNDSQVKPIRGQVARVSAPWQFHAFLDDSDDGNYVIPNTETCIIGGTHQENDFNTQPCPKDREFIMVGCTRIVKGLKNAPVIREWVGLRPGRTSVRIEFEDYETQKGHKLPVIQNYGHGGAGVTLCWGCATDVLKLASQKLSLHKTKATNSKL